MAKTLHPRIQALRNSVGHIPIQRFYPSRKTSNEYLEKTKPKRNSEDSDETEQYFAIWGVSDDYGTEPMPGCFNKSIEDRGPNSKAPGKIIVLNQHRATMPVALPLELKEDSIGLFGKWKPDPVAHAKELVLQIRSGTINNGSYGFQYVWDKMVYDDKTDIIKMFECVLEEVSPVTFGSQRETFVVRNVNGIFIPSDEELMDDTETIIKQLPRKYHLEVRSLINRHISLALNQPIEQKQKPLEKRRKPKQRVIDYSSLTEQLKEIEL